jgi:hypothetical protein
MKALTCLVAGLTPLFWMGSAVSADCPQANFKPTCFGTPQEQAPCLKLYQQRVDTALKQCEADQARLSPQPAYHPPLAQQSTPSKANSNDTYWYHGVNHAEPFFYHPDNPSEASTAKAACEKAHNQPCVSAHGVAPAL